MVMMLVVGIRQTLCQLAGMVVENIEERCDAFPGNAVINARPLQAKAREIANGLGAVFVLAAFHGRGQFCRELIRQADGESFHESRLTALTERM
jgi:hypothetical protein